VIRSLTRIEERWASVALGAIYPSGSSEALPARIGDRDVRAFLKDLFGRIPLTAAVGLRVAIWIVALAPIFLMRRFVTVAHLDVPERHALLDALSSSSSYAVRQLVVALKATGGLLFGAAVSLHEGTPPRLLADRGASSRSSAPSVSERLVLEQSLVRRKRENGRDGIVA
jgi:hypothetical protein